MARPPSSASTWSKASSASGSPATSLTLPFRGGAELVAFLGRKTGISPWVIGGIVVAGAALVLTSPQRRQAIGKYVVPVAEALVKEMERSAAP
jgi:hypothetical protein